MKSNLGTMRNARDRKLQDKAGSGRVIIIKIMKVEEALIIGVKPYNTNLETLKLKK